MEVSPSRSVGRGYRRRTVVDAGVDASRENSRIYRGREAVRERDYHGSDSGYSRSPPRSRGPSYRGLPSTDPRLSMYDGPRSIPDPEPRPRDDEFYPLYDPYASNIPPPPYFLPPVLRQSSVYGSQPPPVTSPYRPTLGYLNVPSPHGPSYYDQYHTGIPLPMEQEAEIPDGVEVDFSALENVHNVPDKTVSALMPSIDAVTEVCGNVSRMLYLRTDDLQSRSGASTDEIESMAAELSGFAMVLSNAREVLGGTERLISHKAFENINTLLLFCKKALQKIRSVITTSRKVPSRLNFLRRDSLNSSLGKAKGVRLNLECVKTSLTAIVSTIILANRQDELHRTESPAIRNMTGSSETLANGNGVDHDDESLRAMYELDAAVERSTSRLEDDILANSRAIKRWQQAERREFNDLYARGMVPITLGPVSPASQWVSQLVPFEALRSNLRRITGPEPFKAIGLGTEEVIASNSEAHINEQEEQARIAAIIRVLLAKWTEIPPKMSGLGKKGDKNVKAIPMTTFEVMVNSGPKKGDEMQTSSRGAIPAEESAMDVESGITVEKLDEKKTKHVSFDDAGDYVIEGKPTHARADQPEPDLSKRAQNPDEDEQVSKHHDEEHANLANDGDGGQNGISSDETRAQDPNASSEVNRDQSRHGKTREDLAVLSRAGTERITKPETLLQSDGYLPSGLHKGNPHTLERKPEPDSGEESSRGKKPARSDEPVRNEDDDIDGLPKAGWEHDEREATAAFVSTFPRPELVPYSYPPPPGGYYSYPQSQNKYVPSSTDQYVQLTRDPYFFDSSASREDRSLPPRSLVSTSERLGEPSRERGYAETMTSYSGEPSRNSHVSQSRTRLLELDAREREVERQERTIRLSGRSLEADRYRNNGSYPRRTDASAAPRDSSRNFSRSWQENGYVNTGRYSTRQDSLTDSDDISIGSGPKENTTKALVLSTNPFGAIVEQLTADLEAAKTIIARKDELLTNTPSLKKFESLEANLAHLQEEQQDTIRVTRQEVANSELKATEKAGQIAFLEANVATSTAKITTLEKRISKRDATIKRLKREKDEKHAEQVPRPPVPDPSDPPAEIVEVVEDVVVVEEDAMSDAAPRRRRSRSRQRSRSRRRGRSRSVSACSYYTFSNISKKGWTEEKVWEKVWTVSAFALIFIISVMMAASLATYLHSTNGAAIKKVLSVMDVNEDSVCSI